MRACGLCCKDTLRQPDTPRPLTFVIGIIEIGAEIRHPFPPDTRIDEEIYQMTIALDHNEALGSTPAKDASVVRLGACPCCGHGELRAILPAKLASDNSLGRLLGKDLGPALSGFDLRANAKSDWSVCEYCALIFARNRPSSAKLADWYPILFQISEERNYNTAQLPTAYIENKKRGAEKLFQQLDAHGIFAGARSLIQFRTGPGHFLDIARQSYPHLDVYGLEYFEHPAKYAAQLLGSDRIARISLPEPTHPFDAGPFDVVVANHFLTHAHEPRKFLEYLKSILSDKGTLVLMNELDHARSLKSMTAYSRGLNFFHKQLFTRDTLRSFIRSCGLTATDISVDRKGKKAKEVMLLCRKGPPEAPQRGRPSDAAALFRSWRLKNRFYMKLRFVIDPIRSATKRT